MSDGEGVATAATRDGGGFIAPGRMPPPRPSSAAGDGEAVADAKASPEEAAQRYAEKGTLLAAGPPPPPDPRTPRRPEQERGLSMGRHAPRLRLAMAAAPPWRLVGPSPPPRACSLGVDHRGLGIAGSVTAKAAWTPPPRPGRLGVYHRAACSVSAKARIEASEGTAPRAAGENGETAMITAMRRPTPQGKMGKPR